MALVRTTSVAPRLSRARPISAHTPGADDGTMVVATVLANARARTTGSVITSW